MLAIYQFDRVSAYQQMMGTEVDYSDRDNPSHLPIDWLNAQFAFADNNFRLLCRIRTHHNVAIITVSLLTFDIWFCLFNHLTSSYTYLCFIIRAS